jgi:hypothetical protein
VTGAIRSLLLMALLIFVPPRANAAARQAPVPVADHHMHIQSVPVVAWMPEMEAKFPGAFEGIDPALFRVRDGRD